MHNLSFTQATLRAIVEQGSYAVLCPDGQLPPRSFTDLRRVEDIALGVLQKYVAAFYDRQRRTWEQEHLQLVPLAKDDPNLAFGSYAVRAKLEFAETVRELVKKADELRKLDEKRYPHIYFDRHLYQPLLVSDKQERMEATPLALNEGEAKFVRDLRSYLQNNIRRFAGREIFLLRNLTQGKGIGFFEAGEGEAFYPDFILWVIEDGQQWISFIDPHGLRNVRGLIDPKVQLHKRLSELEPQLQAQCPTWIVHLTSFIVATSSYEELAQTSWVRDQTEKEFEQEHVVFQDESGGYIDRCMGKILTG